MGGGFGERVAPCVWRPRRRKPAGRDAQLQRPAACPPPPPPPPQQPTGPRATHPRSHLTAAATNLLHSCTGGSSLSPRPAVGNASTSPATRPTASSLGARLSDSYASTSSRHSSNPQLSWPFCSCRRAPSCGRGGQVGQGKRGGGWEACKTCCTAGSLRASPARARSPAAVLATPPHLAQLVRFARLLAGAQAVVDSFEHLVCLVVLPCRQARLQLAQHLRAGVSGRLWTASEAAAAGPPNATAWPVEAMGASWQCLGRLSCR